MTLELLLLSSQPLQKRNVTSHLKPFSFLAYVAISTWSNELDLIKDKWKLMFSKIEMFYYDGYVWDVTFADDFIDVLMMSCL